MLKTMKEKHFVESIIPRLTPLTRIKLLYRLGEEDKFDLNDYKKKVHDKGATVVLVKSSVDEIAGGFTSIPWQNKSHVQMSDPEALLFSVTHEKKYPVQDKDKAVF